MQDINPTDLLINFRGKKKKKKSLEALDGHHIRATWPTYHNTLRSTVHTTLKDWHMRREDARDGACRWWWWIRKCLKVVELMDATSNAHIKYELEKRGTFILLGEKNKESKSFVKRSLLRHVLPPLQLLTFHTWSKLYMWMINREGGR